MVIPDGSTRSERAAVPVVGVLLVIAVVVVLGAATALVALDIAAQTQNETPKAAFTTEYNDSTLRFVPLAGETIAPENIEVVGGQIERLPGEVKAATPIVVEPSNGTVALVYNDGQTSAVLHRASVSGTGSGPSLNTVTYDSEPERSDMEKQCEEGSLTATTFSEPMTVQVELDQSVDTTADLDVTVRDFLGACGAPANGARGTVGDVQFEDGVGSVTIKNANSNINADLSLTLPCQFLGTPCDVNDIDGLVVSVDDPSLAVERLVIKG